MPQHPPTCAAPSTPESSHSTCSRNQRPAAAAIPAEVEHPREIDPFALLHEAAFLLPRALRQAASASAAGTAAAPRRAAPPVVESSETLAAFEQS